MAVCDITVFDLLLGERIKNCIIFIVFVLARDSSWTQPYDKLLRLLSLEALLWL